MTKAVTTSRDPVCGMAIEVARSSRFITYRGMLYHFCSAHCLERFNDIPALYTGSQRIADILPIPKRRKLRLANGNESDIQRAGRRVAEMIGVICEILYGNLIYPAVRYLFHMVSFISFPLIYILIVVCIYLIWRLFAGSDSIKSKGISLLKGIAWALALFYLSWAFNYRRPAFDSKLPLDRSPLDSADWYKELFFAKTELESTRPVKLTDYTLKETEEKVRKEVKLIANEFGYHAPGKMRVKSLWPEGFLLRIKTAGFYLPPRMGDYCFRR